MDHPKDILHNLHPKVGNGSEKRKRGVVIPSHLYI